MKFKTTKEKNYFCDFQECEKRSTLFLVRFFFAELDLDYLERRGGETISCENVESGSKEEESPADSLDRVKVVFLGAPGVGKSSIIRVSLSNRYISLLRNYISISQRC